MPPPAYEAPALKVKALEEALHKSHTFENVFHAIAQPIMLLDRHHKIIRANPASGKGIRAAADKPFVKKELAGTIRSVLDGDKQ